MSTDDLAQRVAEAAIEAWEGDGGLDRGTNRELVAEYVTPRVLAILAPELAAAEQRGYERGRREVVAAQMLGQEQAASIVTGRKRFTKYSCRECGQMVSNSGLGSWQHEQKHVREKERQHEQG